MTTRTLALTTLALLTLAGATYTAHLQRQLAASRAAERATALRASNETARHDTTRDAARDNARLARLLGDSLRAYRKLVVQQEQAPDHMDSALGGRHAGVYAMRVSVRPLETTMSGANADTAGRARSTFHLRQHPYTLDAELSRPPGNDSTALAVRVVLDTIPVNARVQCSPPGDAGIRTASVITTAPPWAAVRIGDVQQAPDVCNAARDVERGTRHWLSWTPLALTIGRPLGAGRAGWSVQLGTGLTFGARR